MVDRQWLGELALVILLAVPLVALARPELRLNRGAAAPAPVTIATAHGLPGSGRISLLS